MPYTHEELDFLFAHPEAIEFASTLELSRKSELREIAGLRKDYGDKARCLVELVQSRRTAQRKIEGGSQWMVDSPSAQQATPSPVADFRAQHLKGLGVERVADVTCSVGTELMHLSRAGISTVGADLDFQRLRMARANVPNVPVLRADALHPVIDAPVVIADPARRGSSGRIHSIKDLMPPLPELIAAQQGRELAVKCAPGIDFSNVEDWAGQVDIVSVDGDVKEACVYTPGLRAQAGGVGLKEGGQEGSGLLRRAVVMRASGLLTLTSAMPYEEDDAKAAAPAGRYLFDPDGAIVRAGLVRHLAAQHGWWQLDPRIAYLTGDTLPGEQGTEAVDPAEAVRAAGARAFEIVEQVPLKKLKAALHARSAARVEILVRGVDVDPDQLRKKLKLKAGKGKQNSWSVVIARIGDAATAFICESV